MPQSQIEQESNCCLFFFTLYIFIKFPAFKKTNNIRRKTISSSSGKRFLAPRILCWFHLFQPAGKWIESLTCSASKEALWVRTTVWFSLCDFRPWADILTEIKHMCRTYMSSTQGFNRWRWKKKMERGGVVSSKRVNYKKSWLSRRGGKAKKAEVVARLLRGKESLKSRQWQRSNSAAMKLLFTEGNICSLCHERLLWPKIILSSKVGSQIAFCILLHQTGSSSQQGETLLKRTDTHIQSLFINLQKLDRPVLR